MLPSQRRGDGRDDAADAAPGQGPSSGEVESLFNEHGAALFSLACITLGDRVAAEAAVTQVLVDLERRPLGDAGEGSHRNQLAGRVYRWCTGGPLRDQEAAEGGTSRNASHVATALRTLSEQQRAAIALSMFGDHTRDDIADLMGLPAPMVDALLHTGLRELRT